MGHVGAGQLNIYFGHGSGEVKCPGHPRGGRGGGGVRGFQMTGVLLS